MLRKFFKDSFIYGVGDILSKAISFILLPFYTRALLPFDYGILDIMTIFSTTICLILPLEITQGLARYYSTEKDPQQKIAWASTCLWFSLFVYLLFFITAWSFSYRISPLLLDHSQKIIEFRLAIISTVCTGMFYVAQVQLRWKLLSLPYTTASLLSLFGTTFFSILFVLVCHWGVRGVFLGTILGTLLGLCYSFFYLRHDYRFEFNFLKWKNMISFSLPLAIMQGGFILTTYFDRIAIKILMSLQDVGLYGVANRFSVIVTLALIGFQTSLAPIVFTQYAQPETPAQVAKIFRYFFMAAFVIFFFISSFARELMVLFTPSEYHSAWSCIPFLALIMIIFKSDIFTFGLDLAKKTKLKALISFCGVVCNIALNFLLIPVGGIMGAAIAALLSGSLVVAFLYYFSQKHYFIPFEFRKIFFSFFLLVLFILLELSFPFSFLPTTLVLKGLIFLVGSISLFCILIRLNELRSFREIITSFLLRVGQKL